MQDPTNRGRDTETPTVVPNFFTPVPEKFEKPVSQELRVRQAQLGQGYTLKQVSYLENQRHRASYKRDGRWQSASEADMESAIRVAKTARTIMSDNVAKWAGNLSEVELQDALPVIWAGYVQQVERPTVIPVEVVQDPVEPEEAPAPGDVVPIQVINRPSIPEDAPRSEVVAPDQLTLGDVLGKIATKK